MCMLIKAEEDQRRIIACNNELIACFSQIRNLRIPIFFYSRNLLGFFYLLKTDSCVRIKIDSHADITVNFYQRNQTANIQFRICRFRIRENMWWARFKLQSKERKPQKQAQTTAIVLTFSPCGDAMQRTLVQSYSKCRSQRKLQSRFYFHTRRAFWQTILQIRTGAWEGP